MVWTAYGRMLHGGVAPRQTESSCVPPGDAGDSFARRQFAAAGSDSYEKFLFTPHLQKNRLG